MGIMSWIFFTKVLIYTVMTAPFHPKPIISTWTEFKIEYDSNKHDTVDENQGVDNVHSSDETPVYLAPTNCSITAERSLETDTAYYIIGNNSASFFNCSNITNYLPQNRTKPTKKNSLTDDVIIKKLPGSFVFPEWASSLAIFLFLFVLFYIVWFTCPLCDEPDNAEIPYANTVS